MIRKLGLWMIALLLFSPALLAAEIPDWSQPVFGAVEAATRPDEARQLGLEWERLLFHWYLFQPNGPDDFNPDAVSPEALANARDAGRQVVGLIKGTPAWASDTGSLGAVPRGLELPYDDPNNTFGSFVTRLVTHYSAQGIHHWIIWNEPDIRPGEGIVEFEGEVEDYFRLLKVAAQAARAADPQAHIQIAGLTWWYDVQHGREPYLARLLQVIAADPEARQQGWYFDGVSAHIYFTTSSVWDILSGYQNILRQFGLQNKEIWLSEFNASPRRDPVTPIGAPFNLSLEQQADFIVQASALALAAGADRLAVYRLYDNDFVPGQTEPWGLIRADGTLRPAFQAYQQVIANFSNASSIRRYNSGGATLVAVQFANRTTHVMWNDTFTGGQFLFYTGGGQEITVADAAGNQWLQPVEIIDGSAVAVIDALPAEQVDMPKVVVAGPVRIVTLPGATRTVIFRSETGASVRLSP